MSRARVVKKVGDPVIRLNRTMHTNWRHSYEVIHGKISDIRTSSHNVRMASLRFNNKSWVLSVLGKMTWLSAPFNAWIREDEYLYDKYAKQFIDKSIKEASAVRPKHSRARKSNDSCTIDDAESAALEAASIAFSAFNPGPQHGHVAYLHRMKAAVDAYKKFKGE